ncbi:O-antigen ligase domain-containing protein [Chamaesiphon sp. GL140_3_metabinner_50]|uniref:O-antigen ligase domain-containing protein n=1 Tax=Chamaesiphon sp. GL140_3_metabinner_50 TaxID=2970812 RepID=UPI0025E240B2|nr:O-antigen ligase domain-containing protein [Chamaesiphon sp. GL140_3_metabinner_50]
MNKNALQTALQPATAWMAILALIAFTGLLAIAGAGKVLNLAFPAGALAVSLLLYWRAPLLYVGFTWWICLLTPLVRRLADYRSGFTDPSPILLTPYLVILVTLVTLKQHLPKAYSQGGLPFLMAFAGIFYAILTGLIINPPVKVLVAALEWLAPVLFGFHLFTNWQSYPAYRQNLQRTLTWGVVVMGSYGIVQYLIAPQWDRTWLINTTVNTMGKPEPLGLRVWSTLNSPEPFAAIMGGCLLLLFTNRSPLRLPAAIVGYLSFLLCAVRSGWLGWLAGLFSLVISLKPKLQLRLSIALLVLAVFLVPLATVEPFSQLSSRLDTFTNLENDQSAIERQQSFNALQDSALTSFVGQGISGQKLDSAIFSMLFELGWIGTIGYAGGLFLLTFTLCQAQPARFDPFIGTARAIAISALVRLPVNVPMLGASGLLLWTFLGIGLAGIKFDRWKARPAQRFR